jgi:DNA polymerase III subunit chi
MPEILFYVLSSHAQHERQEFACKLIEKIYRTGQNCFVLTDSLEQASSLDKQLWTFRSGSFIPHQIYKGVLPELQQTILIGGMDVPESRQNILLNLSATTPPVSETTKRIVEILDGSEECKRAGRQRYKYYQQLGCEIVTHNM